MLFSTEFTILWWNLNILQLKVCVCVYVCVCVLSYAVCLLFSLSVDKMSVEKLSRRINVTAPSFAFLSKKQKKHSHLEIWKSDKFWPQSQ
jgi:hypothetical protein